MTDFAGVYTALVTPFKDGDLDLVSLKNLVRFQLDKGINGFVVSGTTAESPCLSLEEKKRIFDVVRTEAAGQARVIVGTGTNSTSESIELTRAAQEWGADGALVVVPYYNKPPQRGLVAHYKAVAQSTTLPILLYNVPSRTISKLELEAIVELSRVDNIVGIKEATGDTGFARSIVEKCGPDFLVTSGDDLSYLRLLEVGARGIISVASHILPDHFVDWTRRIQRGDRSAFDDLKRVEPLINALYVESNPIPVKAALKMMGVIDSDELRLPLMSLAEAHRPELRRLLEQAELLT